MFKSIVVPLDGSSLSEYAVPFAAEIARRSGGRVTLLRALPESLIVTDIPFSIQGATKKVAKGEVDAVLERHATPGVKMDAVVKVGWPVEEILKKAASADLVVMTTHGRSGLRKWVLGSVADKVIRLAAVPVLAIHPPAKTTVAMARAGALRMFRDIALTLDGSKLAETAIEPLRQMAGEDTRVHLVSILPKKSFDENARREYIDERAFQLESRGLNVVRGVVVNDHPAEAIVQYALRNGCGLVVMATHGASGIQRWILGNVTDKVIRSGTTPVLAIRASRKLWKSGMRPLPVMRKKKKSIIVI